MNNLEINISQIVADELSSYAVFVYLMGSAETDRFNQDSDVDVAIYWKPDIDEKQKRSCLFKLEDIFKREVDLVSLNNIDLIFAIQVLDKGRLLINNDKGFHLNWRAEKLSQYPDFKASRKNIENNILNRKKYV